MPETQLTKDLIEAGLDPQIIRPVSLQALITTLLRGQAEMHGQMPTRIEADPVQVRLWEQQATDMAREKVPASEIKRIHILGVPVFERRGSQPEVIWSKPVLES